MTTIRRRLVRLFCCLLVLGAVARAAEPAKTLIQDTVYRADGTAAAGTLVISWPAFVTADGKPVAAGSVGVRIGANGQVNIPLVPTQGATPAGTYYKVVMNLSDGASSQEYWSVPALSPTSIAAIRSSLVPASVALQVVSREYVDSADANSVRKNGDETITGIKTFASSPLVPSPSDPSAAATKGYVDAALGGATPGRDADTVDGMHASDLNRNIALDVRDFSGATVGATIDAACAALNGSPGIVEIPAGVGPGTSIAGIPDNCTVIDYRGLYFPNEFSQDLTNQLFSGIAIRSRLTATQPNWHDNAAMQLYQESRTGGLNQTGGPWQTVAGIRSTAVSKSPGQSYGVRGLATSFSHGDTVGGEFIARTWGGTSAGDDEGTEAVRAHVQQGNAVFTAAVSSVTDNGATQTINYSGAVNEHVRGEQRYLINTAAAKTVTAGSISTISGAPPAVTLAGVNLLTSLGIAAGASWAAGNEVFCFSAASEDDPGYTLKSVIPIRQLLDATHLVLNYQYQGRDTGWPGASTGAYRIYPCAQLTSFADAGAVTISKGSTNWAAADPIEIPVGLDGYLTGNRIVIDQRLLPAIGPFGTSINNVSPKVFSGSTALYITGPWNYGMHFNSGANRPAFGQYYSKAPSYVMFTEDGASTYIFSSLKAGAEGWDAFGFDAGSESFYFGKTSIGAKVSFSPSTGAITAIKLGGISDTGVVANLNADMIDGKHAGDFLPATTVLPLTKTSQAHKVLYSYDATTGAFANAQLACGDLSDSGAACLRNVGTAAGTLAAGDDTRIANAPDKSTYSDFSEIAAPSAPAAGKARVYAKAGAGLCSKDSANTERCTGSSGGSGYASIQNAGVSLTQRTTLNVPAGGPMVATDDSAASATTLQPIGFDHVYVREYFSGPGTANSGAYVGNASVYTLANVNGTGAVSKVNPGGWTLASGATSGNQSGMWAGQTGGNALMFPAPSATPVTVQLRFALDTVSNDYHALGIPQVQNAWGSAGISGHDGFWCDVTNTASAGTWNCYVQKYSGGWQSTTVATNPAQTADTNKHTLKIVYTNTTVDFYFDDTRVACVNAGGTGGCSANANITNQPLVVAWEAKANENAVKKTTLYGWIWTQ